MASFPNMPLEIQGIIVRMHLEQLGEEAVSEHGFFSIAQHVYDARRVVGALAFTSLDLICDCLHQLNNWSLLMTS